MDWFERWATDRPDTPFLVTEHGVVDFATAASEIRRRAAGFARDFPDGGRVGVVVRPDVESILTALAAPFGGVVLVPLAPDPARRPAPVVLERAGIRTVLDGVCPTGAGRPALVDPAGVHCAIATSGSSGTPRLIRLTWANLESSSAACAEHLTHGPDDVWLDVLPLHHIGGFSILIRSAREGTPVVVQEGFDAAGAIGAIGSGEVTLASFVSVMVERMLDAGLEATGRFRLGLLGGGPVSDRAMQSPLSLLPTYGMTETASQVATADPADPRRDRLVPVRGAEITTAFDGRIVIRGPMVSPGELDGDDRHELVTDDLGRIHDDGRLEVLGRMDDVIVTGGENVMPAAVERVLAGLPGVSEVAVVGVEDDRWGSVVAAAHAGESDSAAVETAARRVLPSHEVPRRWRHVASVPRLPLGKPDLPAIRELFAD